MRARFQPPSYCEMVNLLPDSPQKEKLHEYAAASAGAEHAGFLYRNLLAMQANIDDLQEALNRQRAQRGDIAPGLIRLHIQATRQHDRMQAALHQLREGTYRNACSRLYVETGWRIGPPQWPDAEPEAASAGAQGMKTLEAAFAKFAAVAEKLPARPAAPQVPPEPAQPAPPVPPAQSPAEAVAETGTAGAQPAPRAAGPISRKRIRPLLKSLAKAGVAPELRNQIRRDALQGRYDWGQLRQKVSEMVGAA